MKTDLNEEWFHLFEIHTLTDSDQNWCESKSDQYSLFNKLPNRLTLFKNLLDSNAQHVKKPVWNLGGFF